MNNLGRISVVQVLQNRVRCSEKLTNQIVLSASFRAIKICLVSSSLLLPTSSMFVANNAVGNIDSVAVVINVIIAQ